MVFCGEQASIILFMPSGAIIVPVGALGLARQTNLGLNWAMTPITSSAVKDKSFW